MSELRQRQPAAGSGRQQDTDADTAPRRQPQRRTDDDDPFIGVLDIIRVLVTLVIASCGLSYYMTNTESVLWGYRPWFTRWPVVKQYLVIPPEDLDHAIQAPYSEASKTIH